jgi:hypothetical protein
MASRYWVGGTGNWSDNTNHWSSSTGGSPGASKPTISDNVFFDVHSFSGISQVCTVDEDAYCSYCNFASVSNTPDFYIPDGITLTCAGSFSAVTGMTVTMGASTILMSGTGVIFSGADKTYSTLEINAGASVTIANSNSFAGLSLNPGCTCMVVSGTTQIVSALNGDGTDGTSSGIITLRALTSGSHFHLNHSPDSGTIDKIYYSIKDCYASAGTTWNATKSIDGTGNTNWNITSIPNNRFWIGDAGNWSDENHWAEDSGGSGPATIPTATENALFDSNSFTLGSQTITCDVNVVCLDIDFTGVSNTPTINLSTRIIDIYGNAIFDENMNVTCGTSRIYMENNNKIFNGAGKTYKYFFVLPGKTITINGSNTFTELHLTDGSFSSTIKFEAGSTQIFSRIGALGTLGNVLILQSTSDGNTYTLQSADSLIKTFDYCSIKDCTATIGTFNAYNSVNVSGNTGVNFLGGSPTYGGRYWVGGTGNWKTSGIGNPWSTVSGGVSGASYPIVSDNVYIDINSTTGVFNINENADMNCLDFDCTGLAYTATMIGLDSTIEDLFIYGNITLNTNLDTGHIYAPAFNLKATTNKIITTNNALLENTWIIDGIGGQWTLQDDIIIVGTTSGTLQLKNGTFISNGYNIGINTNTTGTTAKTFNLTGTTITASIVNFSATTGLTFYVPDRVIITGTTGTFTGGSLAWNDLECTATTTIIVGNNTFEDLKLSADKTLKITAGSTQIVSSLSSTGLSGHLSILKSTIDGSTYNISCANDVLVEYWSIRDCVAQDNINFDAMHSTNVSGNSNWTFGESRYWVGNTGNWNDSLWATSSGGGSGASIPTRIDDVYFDANSFGGSSQSIAIHGNAECANMNWTGVLNTPELIFDGVTGTVEIYGDLKLVSGMTVNNTGFSGYINFKAISINKTITSASKTLPDIKLSSLNGDGGWILQDNLTLVRDIDLDNGILNLNNKLVNLRNFVSNGTNIRSLTMGVFGITLSGNWTVSTDASLTITPNSSTITMTGSNKTFTGGGKIYNALDLQGTPATIVNDNIFDQITFHADNTVKFTAGSTQTITTLSGNGTAGHLVTIESTSSGNHFNLLKTSGSVAVSYWSIKDSYVGTVIFDARTECIDVSGNSGWIFLDIDLEIPLTNIDIDAKLFFTRFGIIVDIPKSNIPIDAYTPSIEIHAGTKFTINNVNITINNKYIHLQSGTTLSYGDNIEVPEEFTMIFFMMLPGGFTGIFLDFDDNFKFGYNGDKFYYEKDGSTTYGMSRVLPDGMFKVGISNDLFKVYTNDYIDNIIVTGADRVYESVRFSGEIWIDNVHLINGELSESVIDGTWAEQVRTINSEFLANYEDTLEAGNLTESSLPVDQWRIKRKRATDALYTNIGLIDYESKVTSMSFVDYSPRINVEYEYAIYSVLEGVEGEGFNGYMSVDTWSWVLEEDYVIGGAATPTWQYVFAIQNRTENIVTNRDIKKIENYTVYPSFRTGNRLYDSSGMETIPYTYGTSDSQIQVTLEILEDLKEKINDGLPKILRNWKGQIWRIITHDFSVQYMDEILSQPYTLKFQWDEIGFD